MKFDSQKVWANAREASTEDLLDYADHVFFNKALSDEFGKLAYKEETKGFSWDVPK